MFCFIRLHKKCTRNVKICFLFGEVYNIKVFALNKQKQWRRKKGLLPYNFLRSLNVIQKVCDDTLAHYNVSIR